MTKKLAEHFNLPPIEDIEFNFDEQEQEQEPTLEETKQEVAIQQTNMDMSTKVDNALPMVQGMEELDREMDNYAEKAMKSFDNITDLAMNVDDRNAAAMFESASKMLSAAITAKQAKMDKKMKMIELQMRKQRLDMDNKKTDHAINKDLAKDDPEEVDGRVVGSRSDLLAQIMSEMNKEDKQ